ncbi:MAG: GNAT family N-acetyltransferase [Chloroflexi bacterium]|nr:GNAT family N-acetyltransferase [Chloroflexota bacterium]
MGWLARKHVPACRDPHLRRLGVARRLVEEVEARLRQVGAERITSLVFNEEGAVAFWKSVGYTQDHATDRYAKGPK